MDNKGGKIGPLKSRGKLYLVIVGREKEGKDTSRYRSYVVVQHVSTIMVTWTRDNQGR